jgi:hypothetical protein
VQQSKTLVARKHWLLPTRGTADVSGGEFELLSYRLDFPSRGSLFYLLSRKGCLSCSFQAKRMVHELPNVSARVLAHLLFGAAV